MFAENTNSFLFLTTVFCVNIRNYLRPLSLPIVDSHGTRHALAKNLISRSLILLGSLNSNTGSKISSLLTGFSNGCCTFFTFSGRHKMITTPINGRKNPITNQSQNFLFKLKAAHPVIRANVSSGIIAITNPFNTSI